LFVQSLEQFNIEQLKKSFVDCYSLPT